MMLCASSNITIEFFRLIPNRVRISGLNTEEYGRQMISDNGSRFFMEKYEHRELSNPTF